MTQAERMKAMAEYRARLKVALRKADIAPMDWANSLKSDYLDGHPLLPMQVSLASEALRETWDKGSCTRRAAA